MSEIAAIDDLPEGWLLVPFPEICQINPPKPARDALTPDTPVTFVPMPAVDADSGTIRASMARPFSEVRKGFTAFRNRDVIMAKITPCMENGKAAIAQNLENGYGFGSTEFHVFRSSPAILPELVFYFIRQESFRRAAAEEMTGSVGQKRVPADFLFAVEIPLPPLAEQTRIVAKVETLLTRVNAGRQRLAKISGLMKRFRRSVLAAACSGQLTEEWRDSQVGLESATDLLKRLTKLKSQRNENRSQKRKTTDQEDSESANGDLELFEIPNEWCWVRIRSIMDEREAFCYGVVQPGADHADGVPLIRAGDLDKGTVNSSELRRIPVEVDVEYKRSKISGGEILVTVVGAGIGAAAIVPNSCRSYNIARAVAKIPVREFSPKYVLAWLQTSDANRWMKNASREVARPTLNLEQLETLPVPLPPLDEQHEIAGRVEALLAQADRFEVRLAAAARRVETLTQTILALAFRGELVPTEAELARRDGREYEPAAILLEHIREKRTDESSTGKKRRRTLRPTRDNHDSD